MAKSPTERRIRICVGAISQRFFLRSFVVFYPLLIYEHVVTLNSYRAYRAVFFHKTKLITTVVQSTPINLLLIATPYRQYTAIWFLFK